MMTEESQDPGTSWHPTTTYFTIGFVSEACELTDEKIRGLQNLAAEIVPAEGEPFDCIVVGTDEWNGEKGHPVKVRRVNTDFDPVGPVLTVDAKHIIIY